jgi:hypothetical protein
MRLIIKIKNEVLMKFSKQEKIEADKQIAHFMGWCIDNSFPDKDRVWRSPHGDLELDTTFKFSNDWNELMKVYSAVNDMKDYNIGISISGICYIEYYKSSEEVTDIDRKWTTYDMNIENVQESVYMTLAMFTKDYNELQFKKNKS